MTEKSTGKRSWVKELRPGTTIEECFAVRSREERQRRGGGPYLALTLGDKTGDVAALVWENVEQLAGICEPGGVVRIRGQVQRYNQRLQVVVRVAEKLDQDSVDMSLFVRSSKIHPKQLWAQLEELIEGLTDSHLKQLAFRVFSDSDVSEKFRIAPAARGMHHAFRSGLLEHTVSTATAAKSIAKHYGLDVDIVVVGSLFHDLGKIWELDIDSSITYTDEGRLIGHLTQEVLFVDRLIGEMPTFPAELRMHLLHILLSHHGEYEFGSPRRPKTPEALVVHVADNLDSKMAGMMEAIGSYDNDDAWTDYSRILERYIYRRRPPTERNDAGS